MTEGHMHQAIFCASVSLWAACAPSLSDGDGARCSEVLACDDGFTCYRGFCLPEAESPAAPATVVDVHPDDAGALEADAGRQLDTDAGAAPRPGELTPAPPDPKPAPPSRATSASDAAVGPEAGPAASPDAGASADAGAAQASDAAMIPVLDGFVLPEGCKLKECCQEAQRAAEREQEEEDEKEEDRAGKACGCDDPQLFSALLCSAL
jgi:hypothetical protein